MKTRNQKGITLIALIITIIVMLILVGVSVSVALNTGLFKSAQGAAKNTETEKLKEQELASGAIITETLEEVGAIKPNIGQIADLSKGDIVYYDEDKSGTNDEDEKYVVLYNDDTYGCQIISINLKGNVSLGASEQASGNAVTKKLREEAKAAYNNAVEILNTEASKYLNRTYGAYARSLGCNPMYGTKPLAEALELYDTKEYISVEELLEDAGTGSYIYEEGGAAEDFLDGVKQPDRDYVTDWEAIYKPAVAGDDLGNVEFMQNFNGTFSDYFRNYDMECWLASRHLEAGGSMWFNIRILLADSDVYYETYGLDLNLPTPTEGVNIYTKSIRPVITLKAECTVNTGAGNIDDPYTLSI